MFSRFLPRGIDLVKILPAARGQSGGKAGNATVVSKFCSRAQSNGETNRTASAAFRLIFQPFDGLQPGVVIPVAVNDFNTEPLTVHCQLGFSFFVLGLRKNVWVEIKDNGADVMSEHPLKYGRRTRRTTTVKNDCFHDGEV